MPSDTNWNDIALQQADNNETAWQLNATNSEYNGILSRWFNPGEAQKQTWSQQMVSQMYQNNWNSEVSKMNRAKEAGINLNTAAAAIAGGAASSVASPAAQPVGDPVSGAASVGQSVAAGANAFTQGKANLAAADASSAAADKAREETKYVGQLAQSQIMEKVGILSDYFENNGCGSIEAAQLAITLGEGDFSTVLHILNADGSVRKYKHQMDLLDNEVKNEDKRFEEIGANIAYLSAKEGEANANELYLAEKQKHEDILGQIDQRRRDILDGLRADPYFDQWQTLVYLADKYGVDSPEYNNCLKQIKDSYYYQAKGLNQAEIEDGYNKALSSLKADKDLQSLYAPYLAMIEANKQAVIDFIKMITENPKDIQGIIGKLANLLGQFGLSGQLDKNPVNNAKRPVAGHPFKSE